MTVSTRQWHLAGQEFKTQKTTWTNSSCQQCNRVLTFKASVQKSNWHWNATYTIYKVDILWRFKVWMFSHTRGNESQTCDYRTTPLLRTFHTYPGTWGKLQYLTKILHLLQFIKASKKAGISQSQSQFCTYSIGGRNWWTKTA